MINCILRLSEKNTASLHEVYYLHRLKAALSQVPHWLTELIAVVDQCHQIACITLFFTIRALKQMMTESKARKRACSFIEQCSKWA